MHSTVLKTKTLLTVATIIIWRANLSVSPVARI